MLVVQERQERDGRNNVVREYTYGLGLPGGIGGLLHLSQGGAPYSYLYDGKGNVTALLDGVGNVAAVYQYDPFGVPRGPANTLSQPMQFSTKPYDDKTGLSYYGYRFYAPALSRWMTRDPIGERGGINLYGFVDNNPINYVDPDGRVIVIAAIPFAYYYLWGGVGLSVATIALLNSPPAQQMYTDIGNTLGPLFEPLFSEPLYPDNPDNARDKFKRKGRKGARQCKDDGSIWEKDHSGHGGPQWKRWPDEKSWENDEKPQSIWPDGRIRK